MDHGDAGWTGCWVASVRGSLRKEGHDMGKTFYTLSEAAAKLGVTSEELSLLVRDDRLHVRQEGARKVIGAAEVDALALAGLKTAGRPPAADTRDAIDISDIDRSLDEGFVGGSGLLELTRERYETSLGDVRYQIRMETSAESALPAEAGGAGETWMTLPKAAAALGLSPRTLQGLVKAGELESRVRPDGRREVLIVTGPTIPQKPPAAPASPPPPPASVAERQIQIARTALGMAKKLAEAHENELSRTRRDVRLGWVLLVLMAVAAGAVLWWAVQQNKLLNLERAETAKLSEKLSDTKGLLNDEKLRAAKLSGELDSTRADRQALQTRKDQLQEDLTTAREALADSKATAKILAADLETATAKTAELSAELARVKAAAATRPATQPATARAGG